MRGLQWSSADARTAMRSLVPEPLRAWIRETRFWRERYNAKHGHAIAAYNKRLDLCAAQFSHWLTACNVSSLRGMTCLEVGTGWLATHAIVCHLLGAKKVVATDINPVLQPQWIATAVREAVPYIVRDILSPFEDHSLIRARFDRLRAIEHFDLAVLQELGIEYVAPIDLAQRPVGQSVDFIYSASVLEHVPVDSILPLLRNLSADLAPDGSMFHLIHLEDHKDIDGAPFPFLAIAGDEYDRTLQYERGNRIRRSQWQRLVREVDGLDWRVVFEFQRTDKPLPERIDASIIHDDEADLRVSHLGFYAERVLRT